MHLIEMIDEARSLMGEKMLEIEGKVCTIVGDVHADIEALEIIEREIEKMAIFLGDYADRGEYPMEVYEKVLSMFLNGRAFLLRGNHESENVYPHELPFQLSSYEEGEEIYEALKKLWEKMPVSAILNGEIFLVHGGVPCTEINKRVLKDPDEETMLQMMWNDPWEREECGENFRRGFMFFFGRRATKKFLDSLGVRIVVRSHEPYKVLKVEQNGMVVTLGSCANPYGLANFAIIKFDAEKGFRDGYDFVRKFGYEFSL